MSLTQKNDNNILVLGLQAVGKTSIIKRFKINEFNEKVRPTLGAQIIRMMFEKTKLLFYDLGGQKSLRKNWYDQDLNPKAMIFVIDATAEEEEIKENQVEFGKVLEKFYSDQDSVSDETQFPPFLILANKIDLLDKPNRYFLNEVFYLIPKNINYKFGYTSAKTGEGIDENIKWLVGEMLKII